MLSGCSLACYADSSAEELRQPQEAIDLSAGCHVTPVETSRNYGFRLQTSSGHTYVLSAMTSGIRHNWMQAIEKCMQLQPGGATSREPRRSRRYVSMPGLSNGDASAAEKPDEVTYVPSRRSRQREAPPTVDPRGRGPRDRHTMTCTWPYENPSSKSVTSPREESQPHVTNVSDYLEEGERRVALTPQQEEELDHIEKNIRSIHRKSISDFVQQHKVPHHDKFESASSTRDSDNRSRASSSDRSGWSSPREAGSVHSSPVGRARQSSISEVSPHRRKSDPRSPGYYRAPSAKVKDRSRAKSPRPRSPPPDKSQEELALMMGHPPDLISSSEAAAQMIENQWRQVIFFVCLIHPKFCVVTVSPIFILSVGFSRCLCAWCLTRFAFAHYASLTGCSSPS